MLPADHLSILRHALGLAEDGSGTPYRNHFVTNPDDAECRGLEAQGLMKECALAPELTGGGACFVVTESGRQVVASHTPLPKRLTRDQRRYRAFLDADCGLSFSDWLRRGGAAAVVALATLASVASPNARASDSSPMEGAFLEPPEHVRVSLPGHCRGVGWRSGNGWLARPPALASASKLPRS